MYKVMGKINYTYEKHVFDVDPEQVNFDNMYPVVFRTDDTFYNDRVRLFNNFNIFAD